MKGCAVDIPSVAQRRAPFPTEQEEAHEDLLAAARAALRYLNDADAHLPEGYALGGEGRLRAKLRRAIRRAS